MTIQYIITFMILATCIVYVAFSIYKSYKKAKQCKDFHCAGCAFYEKCNKNKKKVSKKFGGIK